MDHIKYPEGATPLDSNEIEGLKFKHITIRSELDHLEQANIESGLIWLERKKNADLLSEKFVKELHLKLFAKVWRWAGTFRQTEKNIGVDPYKIPLELRLLFDDVQYWVKNKTFKPIEAAARFHHRMVYIHPFPNGNGRHARIMADALLTKIYGDPPIDWAGGYDLWAMNDRRKLYILALREADKGNMEPLLKFVSY